MTLVLVSILTASAVCGLILMILFPSWSRVKIACFLAAISFLMLIIFLGLVYWAAHQLPPGAIPWVIEE